MISDSELSAITSRRHISYLNNPLFLSCNRFPNQSFETESLHVSFQNDSTGMRSVDASTTLLVREGAVYRGERSSALRRTTSGEREGETLGGRLRSAADFSLKGDDSVCLRAYFDFGPTCSLEKKHR